MLQPDQHINGSETKKTKRLNFSRLLSEQKLLPFSKEMVMAIPNQESVGSNST
jgi:hypothetical protein